MENLYLRTFKQGNTTFIRLRSYRRMIVILSWHFLAITADLCWSHLIIVTLLWSTCNLTLSAATHWLVDEIGSKLMGFKARSKMSFITLVPWLPLPPDICFFTCLCFHHVRAFCLSTSPMPPPSLSVAVFTGEPGVLSRVPSVQSAL